MCFPDVGEQKAAMPWTEPPSSVTGTGYRPKSQTWSTVYANRPTFTDTYAPARCAQIYKHAHSYMLLLFLIMEVHFMLFMPESLV